MAFLDIFISNKSIGIIMGKPNIAMSVPLFDALDAILEIMVNVDENPIAPNSKLKINKDISSTGLPKRIM